MGINGINVQCRCVVDDQSLDLKWFGAVLPGVREPRKLSLGNKHRRARMEVPAESGGGSPEPGGGSTEPGGDSAEPGEDSAEPKPASDGPNLELEFQ
ncbi:unnamed protein product [Phytophthora fragariaefolia]|uniref:Unnamed protein product n=1 Tax=Phytophthora fragariaefolia TaxID=1490495 RepID=A0A9W6XYK3_9STRA|nr:unnamed protein product [Phytophthora fragariaefolia]